jgi:hypothetical protein
MVTHQPSCTRTAAGAAFQTRSAARRTQIGLENIRRVRRPGSLSALILVFQLQTSNFRRPVSHCREEAIAVRADSK